MEYTASKVWELYQKGIDYINKKRLIAETNKCWNFYIGKQWEGLKCGSESPPFFNIIHQNVMRLVTTIYSNRLSVTYTDLEGRTELQPIYNMLQIKFKEDYERAKEDTMMRTTLKEAAITGDGIQFFGYGADMSKVQRIDNTSILYGDESEPDIQKQPYFIIYQRETVASVRSQARKNGIDEDEISRIVSDTDTNELIGNRQEVDANELAETGKVTTIIYFTKNEEGIVCTLRSTKAVVYEPFHELRGEASEIDMRRGTPGKGLRLYPVCKLSWELRPNDARGVSQALQLIPNQMEINKCLARDSMSSKNCAFPRLVYIEDSVVDPDLLDTVGGKIALRGGDVNEINKLITYLQPATTNGEANRLIHDLIEITQEISGSGETTMGNIDLTRVAASAIVAVNEQAQSMHDEQVANLAQFGEDLATLWAELHIVYEPDGFVVEEEVTDPVTGALGIERNVVTQEMLDELRPAVRMDVTKENSFTIQARDKWLDDLLNAGLITLETRCRMASEGSPIPKHEMLRELERIKAEQMEMQAQQMAMQPPHKQ